MSSSLSPAVLRLALGAAAVAAGGLALYYLRKGRGMARAVDGLKFVERDILEYALAHGREGNPASVYEAIDYYCYNFGWAMNTGDKKGEIVDEVIRNRKPRLLLELGGYVGYSAIRFGHQQALATGESAKERPLYVSVEIDPLMSAISTKLLEHAGLGDNVKVVIGTLSSAVDKVKALVAQHTGAEPGATIPFDMVYIDHNKSQYLPDFKLLEELGFIGPGTVVVADNIIFPGAPEYLKFLTEDKKEEYENRLIESTVEYLDRRDAVLISVKK